MVIPKLAEHRVWTTAQWLVGMREISKVVIAVEGVMGQFSPGTVDYEPLGFVPLGVVCDISKENVESLPKYLYED